jgi:hypothetical protein
MMAVGGCACGEIRYRIPDDPICVNCCHCTDCQTETGSAFAVNIMIEVDRVEVISGTPVTVITPSESGKGQKIQRCPSCQVALWNHYGGAGDGVSFVRAGTLDDPSAFSPMAHIYTRSKVAWLHLPDDPPVFDGFYDPKTFWSAEALDRVRAARRR